MKKLSWWFVGWETWQQRYAAWNVCPQWGHKPMTLGDYDGKFDKFIGTTPKCANCGQEIPE